MADKYEEKKFVSLLASRLKDEHHSFDGVELDLLFGDAVSNLPKSELKTALKKHYQAHLKKLKSVLAEKTSQELLVTEKPWTFNLFREGGIDTAINKATTSQSFEERNDLCKTLWCCYPFLKDSQKIFSTLKEENDTNDLTIIEEALQCTVGCFYNKSILECLKFLLREFSRKCESCITDNQRSTCTELQQALLRYIVLMNHRWMSCINNNNIHSKETLQRESYEDLMAALLSMYTDLVLVTQIADASDCVIDSLASLIFIVLGHSPEHCMDVILQVAQPTVSLLPLLRCILERNKGPLDHRQYIKFICLARLAVKVSSTVSTEKSISIHKVAESQAAPPGFVSFLLKTKRSLVESLKIAKKMSLAQITSCLLGDIHDEDMEALLDISTECSPQSNEHQTSEDSQETDVSQANQPTESLFFIDSSGGQENTDENQVEFEENVRTEALLRKQVKSLIDEFQKDSASEDEDVLDDLTLPVKPSNKSNEENKTQEVMTRKKKLNTVSDSKDQDTKKSKANNSDTSERRLRRSTRKKPLTS